MAARARVMRRKSVAAHPPRRPSAELLFQHLVHDLRNPLGIIDYFAEAIPTAAAEERDELCERVRVNARRALHVLEEFVLLSDLRRGRSRLQSAPFDPGELVDEVASEVEAIERRNGQIRRRVAPGVRLTASRLHVTCAVRALLREVLRASAADDALDLAVDERPGEVTFRLIAPLRHDLDGDAADQLPIAGLEGELAHRVAALHRGRLTIEHLAQAGVITLALPAVA